MTTPKVWLVLLMLMMTPGLMAAPTVPPRSILSDANIFPIGVWLQNPQKAAAYQAAGINFYLGLWDGPTEAQLTQLKQHQMPVICEMNGVAIAHRDNPLIIGWMHGDEPDNAQAQVGAKGWDWPVPPATIVSNYKRLKNIDPSRPILLNLGKGVAFEKWVGRGPRTGHLEDYPAYLQGCDIGSFDIYPVADAEPETQGKLWYVAQGVERMVKWTNHQKPIWNVIEASRISSGNLATPAQMRAMVWMSIIHGSRGLVYFSHLWKPQFNESALLDNPVTLEAVTQINREVQQLAAVINSPTLPGTLSVESSDPEVPIATGVHQKDGALYVFAVSMRDKPTRATFTLKNLKSGRIQRLGKNASNPLNNALKGGAWTDQFEPYGVQLYKISGQTP